MKNSPQLLVHSIVLAAALFLVGCTTEIGPDGQSHKVMTPFGAAAVQAVSSAGIGAGTGALLKEVNPVAAGAIAAGAGSIGSQAINAFIPKATNQGGAYHSKPTNQQLYVRSSDGRFFPAKIGYTQQPDGSYVQTYTKNKKLFRQLSNGSFVPVN